MKNLATIDAVSFAGCGALNFYQTGVGYALQQAGLSERLSYAGASAGAGLGLALAGGLDARDVATQMVEIMRPYGYGRVLRPAWAYEVAQEFCRRFITDETFERSRGRLTISVTSAWPTRSWVVSEFTSQDDLADALTASCFLPHLGQRAHSFRGKPCIDGGFTNNQPITGSHCLKVSPFWFQVGTPIKPSPRVRADYALRVPTTKRAWWLFERGVRDFERFANPLTLRKRITTLLGITPTKATSFA